MSLRVLTPVVSDAATLTSSDFVAGLPVTNLQVEGRGRVARTADATGSKVINGDLAGVSALSGLVLYNHNLSGTALLRLQAWDGLSQTGTMVYDSGSVNATPPVGWGDFGWGAIPWGANIFYSWGRAFTDLWFPAVGALSFRITITDTSNPDGYLQIKRLLLGPYFEPFVNLEVGMQLHWEDNSEQTRTAGGSLRTDNQVLYRVLRGKLAGLKATERAPWMDLLRQIGKRSEVFISVYPDAGGKLERDHAVLGKFTQMPDITTLEAAYTSDLVFEEV